MMKDLKQFILEGKKHVDQATIGDFAKWACLGEFPDGKKGKVTPDDCEGLYDNGWFDNFGDEESIAKFLNDNWDENIKVESVETPNDWEVSFKFKGQEYIAAFMNAFGTYDDD